MQRLDAASTLDAARTGLPAVVVAMSATAWLLMWQLGASPWGQWVHHHHHGAAMTAPAHDGGAVVALGAMFVAGWVVMTTAMMLPTTLPLVGIFLRLTAARADRVRLTGWLLTGYVAAWAVCGVLVFAASLGLQAITPDRIAARPQIFAAGLFLVAGAFQFSRLKYACLDKCRSPMSFVSSRWRGTHHRWQSYRLGVEHGIFCVGCCWALMLLMFAFGAVNLAWMLALAAVMALEKNMPWGRRLSAPVGVVLLIVGAALAVV